MLRSLYLRAKRPLQQQLRKMNETALERTEQSLKQQEDGGKLLQQDFLSNIYGPGFHLRRAQIHSSLQVEESLERRKDSLQTALLVSSSFPTQETPDELNPLTTENFQTGGNFPATCSFSAEGQIGDYGCSLEVDTNGNASFEMSETGAADVRDRSRQAICRDSDIREASICRPSYHSDKWMRLQVLKELQMASY